MATLTQTRSTTSPINNTGVVFMQALRTGVRGALWWGIGLGFFTFFQVAALPNVDSIRQVGELLETMPPFLLQMFGTTDVQFLGSPTGYIGLRIFGFFPLLLMFYAVTAGLNVFTNDEERGITDVLFSHPVTRTQVVVEKSIASLLLIVFVVALMTVSLFVGLTIAPEISSQIDSGAVLAASVGMLPIIWIAFGFTLMVAGFLRNRGLILGVSLAFVFGSYFYNTIAESTSGTILSSLSGLSYFSAYNWTGIMTGAGEFGGLFVVIAVTLVFIAVGVFAFNRRDIGA